MNKLREDLGIDNYLELIKEDKNLNMSYVSFSQYMYFLEQENQQLKEQLQQRDEVIEEAVKYVQDNMSYTEIRKWIDIGKFEITNEDILDQEMVKELLNILNKYKNKDEEN